MDADTRMSPIDLLMLKFSSLDIVIIERVELRSTASVLIDGLPWQQLVSHTASLSLVENEAPPHVDGK